MSGQRFSRTVWNWLFGPIPDPLDRSKDEKTLSSSPIQQQPMSREQQTWLIVAAIFGAMLLYFAYDRITNPNLDGMHPYDRCSYWAYWHNHGGSPETCRMKEAQAAADRIRSNSDYDPEMLTPEELNATIPTN